jgi:SAM-dependent methyltransferase
MSDAMAVFDRAVLRRRRDRAAAGFHEHDFLAREVAERLTDRLADVRRSFPLALDLGCGTGQLGAALAGRSGIATLVQADLSEAMARRAGGLALAADEEFLPFNEASFDLVVSNLALHWVNDLPGALIQIGRALKPDGLFLAAMLGGETLHELRAVLTQAEIDIAGGVSPRVSPAIDLRDAGMLLQRAGFALPVVDADTIVVTYGDAFALMRELRGMAATNAVLARRQSFTRRAVLMRAAALYAERHAEAGGRVRATFQIITLTGWRAHSSQQTPLRPGTAKTRLAAALGTLEHGAGDKAKPG